ncbi:hypothetical protein [Konateibacter massiliensis]|uniref:hypothetical protein n=1 Tax=Konateibacter massiliensis TaxID=2002841 RepID=UPI000C14F551|nr:hypothetical protein [Konateibacter massiliensis]
MKYAKINRNINRAVFSAFICIFLAAYPALPAKAADNVSIELTYGYNSIAKSDSNTPITISVTNEGEEIKGRVQVLLYSLTSSNSLVDTVFSNGYKEKNYMYEEEADIAAGTIKDISMVVPFMNQVNRLKVLLYDEYNNVIASKDIMIEVDNYYYYIYTGILTDVEEIRSYFENTALYQYNDYTLRAVLLEDEDIPSKTYGLDTFNVLITDDEHLDMLTKEQREVIYNWIKNGGYLVNLSKTGVPSEVSWENLIPDAQLKKMNYSYPSYSNWSITYALSNVFMGKLPSFGVYVIVLILYLILIGPFLYIVLKKLNKRKYFWMCEIAGSLLFMTIIIALGSSTRLKAPFINYFKIVTYNDNTVDNSVYFNIRAPYNNGYKLYVDKDYSIKPLYDYTYYSDPKKSVKVENYNVGITKGENESTITVQNDVAFTKETFYAEKTEHIEGESLVKVDMNVFEDKVSGSVTNGLDSVIENAAIIIYNKIIFLDTIPAGSTIDLGEMSVYTYNPKFKYGLTNEITGVEMDKKGFIKDGYTLQNQKKAILDFYLEKNFGVYTKCAYLIGFTADRNQLDIQLDSSYDAYGMTMVEVPVKINYTSDGYLYTTYVPIKNEEYSSSGDIMYTDEMILTYNLGRDLSDISLYFHDLSYYDEEYYKNFTGNVYFYNRNSGLYDPFELSEKKLTESELKPYLNEGNEIIIKYVEPFDKEGKQALLPSLSTTGRVNNAKN